MWNDDWSREAVCKKAQPDELFVRGAAQNLAKRLCTGCPVKTECLAEALDGRLEWGVWGGMTERERRALLNRRPNVTSWRRLLETAMEGHHAAVSASTVAQPVPA
jgi:WhiB family redox-sensing transcriptional regulator